jgi:hypothetical protein
MKGLERSEFASLPKLMRYVADSTQGFTLLLAGLKAWLEHGIQLNLTPDRYPKGIEDQQFE